MNKLYSSNNLVMLSHLNIFRSSALAVTATDAAPLDGTGATAGSVLGAAISRRL